MGRNISGPFLLTVAQFLVAIVVFVAMEAVIPTDSRGNKVVIAATVVFAVAAVTWGYWNLQGGGWGISRGEYRRRKEELQDDDSGREPGDRPTPLEGDRTSPGGGRSDRGESGSGVPEESGSGTSVEGGSGTFEEGGSGASGEGKAGDPGDDR